MSKKSNFLREQEIIIQNKWGRTTFEANAPIDSNQLDKKKFFATFPFPYTNSVQHLGHVFTILKADIIVRHYRTRGYHCLFPFGYHLTGIPIVAAANKLKKELDDNKPGSQYDIMVKSGVSEADIPKFIDPVYWTQYFPNISLNIDLPSLGCAIDYRRSFITTELNPYFDSFVKWQFNILARKNLLKFGKKLVIYSPLNGQPCSDADRSVGEGVEIVERKIALISNNGYYLYVTYDQSAPQDNIVRSNKLQSETNIVKGEINILDSPTIYMEPIFHTSIMFQQKQDDLIKCISKPIFEFPDFAQNLDKMPSCNLNHGSCFYTSNPHLTWITYYEPESMVISRSGDQCIVANTDQWYILYDEPVWQQSVYDYVANKVEFTDLTVKNLMLETIKQSHPWPFSRTFGLGTSIPFDEKYLIDSLSDSTIYMAYYTVAHLITKIPKEELSDDVWNSIFYNVDTQISVEYGDLFEKMKREFNYWYPMDLRVSGKDLITNHLTMMFFNHWAIFGSELMPKKIYANGHILINGEKMSKSKGNFITLKQAIDNYGVDATRFVAGTAGDDTNDASFNENEVDNAVLALYAEVENWAKVNVVNMRTGPYQFIDHLHLIILKKILDQVIASYDILKFRDVIKYGFYEIQAVRNKYQNPHQDIYKLYLQAELAITAPFAPHWAEYLSTKYNIPFDWPIFQIEEKYNNIKTEWINEFCQMISGKLSTRLKKFKKNPIPTSCRLTFNRNIDKYLNELSKHDINNKDDRKNLVTMFKNSTMVELITYLEKFQDTYGKSNIMQWLVEDHQEIIRSYLSVIYPNIQFEIVYPIDAIKGDPLNPEFNFT